MGKKSASPLLKYYCLRSTFPLVFNLPRLNLSEVQLVKIGFSYGWDLFGLLRLAVKRGNNPDLTMMC